MRVRIKRTCTECGLCCDTCPEVFEMGDNMAQVIVDEVPDEYEEEVQQAADECPVEAIKENPENLPPDLAEVVDVWPELPEHIRAAIKSLVQGYRPVN